MSPNTRRAGPVLVALVATVATLATLAPGARGPGVTCDELYHVAVGKSLVSALRQQGPGFFLPENIRRNFPWKPGGPPVHPPLGNWILGWTHHLFDPAPDDPAVISITAARFAPAVAFGLLVLMVGLWTTRAEGPLAGTVAAAAVFMVPRLFGHAHLAALDMLTTLFFIAAVLAVAEAAARGGRWWYFALAGIVWGLALLVRLHGLLVLPPVAVWLFWRLGRRAAGPLAAWFAAGAVTMFVGWPWLWLAPMTHLRQYLGTATGRQAINVFYIGRVWADRDVPWHYPWVMLVVVLPLGLLLLGVLGIFCCGKRLAVGPLSLWEKVRVSRSKSFDSSPHPRPLSQRERGDFPQQELGIWAKRRWWKSDPGGTLVVGVAGFVLLVFSWPGVPVYDGVRLFLMVLPLWAVLVGIGAKWLIEPKKGPGLICAKHPPGRSGKLNLVPFSAPLRLAGLGLLIMLQGTSLIVYHPCQLSHYSLLVGGLHGADRLGFEATYWGDSVRESLLAEAARRAKAGVVLFGPNLAPFQAPAVQISSPALMKTEIRLTGWAEKGTRFNLPQRPGGCFAQIKPGPFFGYAIVYHRKADLEQVAELLRDGRVVREYSKQGVWLCRLMEFTRPVGQEVRGKKTESADQVANRQPEASRRMD